MFPTFIVFLTKDSSKIAILAATKRSCSPKYSQPFASITPDSYGGPAGSCGWEVNGADDAVTNCSVVAQ